MSRIDPERMGKIWEKLKEPDPWPRQFTKSIRERQEGVLERLSEIKDKTFDALTHPRVVNF